LDEVATLSRATGREKWRSDHGAALRALVRTLLVDDTAATTMTMDNGCSCLSISIRRSRKVIQSDGDEAEVTLVRCRRRRRRRDL